MTTLLRLIVTTALAAIVGASPALGQQSQRSHRVGVLFSALLDAPRIEAIRKGIQEATGKPGTTFVLEARSAAGEPERLPALAAELVKSKVDVILAIGPPSVRAARDATRTIPIVANDLETDPVKSGLVASLGRPGGNVTGIFLDAPEIAGKWIQMLQQAVPGLQRVAVLWDPATDPAQVEAAESAAQRLGIDLHRLQARRPAELSAALRLAVAAKAGGLLVLSSPLFGTEAPRIAELALQHKMPSIMLFPAFAHSGGLLAYGPDNLDVLRQSGVLVGKVLDGATPATLPAERPTRFQLLANLRTAEAMNISLPQSIFTSADELIR